MKTSGDAPSAKAISNEDALDLKLFFRMGAHNFTVTYDGQYSDISMPFNDIALTIKSSIPTTTIDDSANIKLGVRTEYIFDENNNIVGVIPKAYSMKVKLNEVSVNSHNKYESNMEEQIYG
jgi:hypothetical protein